MKYVTEEELAERIGVPVEKVANLRVRNRWPYLRFGRYDIRFTDAQVVEIERIQTVTPTRKPRATPLDQTSRSARRTA